MQAPAQPELTSLDGTERCSILVISYCRDASQSPQESPGATSNNHSKNLGGQPLFSGFSYLA